MSKLNLTDYVARPSLAFRVGVTGSRQLGKQSANMLQINLETVLAKIRGAVLACQADERARRAYRDAPPILRVISPLAAGADQLVAETALALGFQLDVPMPFERDVYLEDFGEAPAATERDLQNGQRAKPERECFEALLENAGDRILAIDGGRAFPGGSYQAVGRHVVRQSDLLIAIWDGHDENGRGGTAQIVRYATHIGVPVVWFRIDESQPDFGLAADEPPFWIAQPRDLHEIQTFFSGLSGVGDAEREGKLVELKAKTWRKLTATIESELLPKDERRHHARDHFQRVSHAFLRSWLGRLLFPAAHPDRQLLQEFFKETSLPKWSVFGLYDWFLDKLSGVKPLGGYPEEAAAPEGIAPVWNYWKPIYAASDALAVGNAKRYRSSYVATFALGALALVLAVFGVVLHAFSIAATELVVLLMIMWLVFANHAFWWQDKLIAYRLLAELCRKQQSLVVLGGSLPIRGAADVASEGPTETADKDGGSSGEDDPDERSAWVGWYFKAMVRAAPMQTGSLVRLVPETIGFLQETLIAGQADYHDNRARRYGRASERLERGGTWFFVLAIVMVIMELILNCPLVAHAAIWHAVSRGEELRHGLLLVLGFAVVILPILSAALVGIRSYAELELMEALSKRMSTIIRRTEKRLDELGKQATKMKGPLPLLSQEVAEEIAALAGEMLKDVSGWTQVSRVKAVEAG